MEKDNKGAVATPPPPPPDRAIGGLLRSPRTHLACRQTSCPTNVSLTSECWTRLTGTRGRQDCQSICSAGASAQTLTLASVTSVWKWTQSKSQLQSLDSAWILGLEFSWLCHCYRAYGIIMLLKHSVCMCVCASVCLGPACMYEWLYLCARVSEQARAIINVKSLVLTDTHRLSRPQGTKIYIYLQFQIKMSSLTS